ncbi:MAG TPA: septum formation initiator family protein [Micropepsaceae bacterium]|nr:septum formation initiator family protein [Micropepsaceae bacterium]
MKLRRRLAHLLLLPAICCAISGYFGYSFLFGERGLIAWRSTQDQLSLARHDLAQLRNRRETLQHRISLLDDDSIDPDLLDEVAHNLLLESRPGEVVIPREKR